MKVKTLTIIIVVVLVLIAAAFVENTYRSGSLNNKGSNGQPAVSYSAEILNDTLAATTSNAAQTITVKNTGAISIENITSELYNGTALLQTMIYVGPVSAGMIAAYTTGPSITVYYGQQYTSNIKIYFTNGAYQSFNKSITLTELGPVNDSLLVKSDKISLTSGSSLATWAVTFYNNGTDEIMYAQAHLTSGGQTYQIDLTDLKPGQSYTGKLSNVTSLSSGQSVYVSYYAIYLDGQTSNLQQKVTV
ncbi:MAG: hypothetical protein JRN19_06555 [Nitrososphaerota archaeon]|nr:hypothetical protein [Nitrososphaerota archaeon]MDG7052092.1 hypothetical protein [Nitrososphaerota archaeon]